MDGQGTGRRRPRLDVGLLDLVLWVLVLWALAGGPARAVRAGEDEPVPAPAPAGEEPPRAQEALAVAVIRGHDVNLRVGPRIDVRPVTQLHDGAVLVIVERVPGWVGVRVPAGFPAAVSGSYLESVGEDGVRVVAGTLNLRVHPPGEGKPLPGAFRDRVARGEVLPLLRREGDWVWVLAPETTRAYVSVDYVRELGPPGEHEDLLRAAREERRQRIARLAAERRARTAQLSGQSLREAIGAAQQALYRLRIEAGWERAPVVTVANGLDAAMEAGREAPVAVRKLAVALRQDLEAELEIRVARKDAEVARLRGLEPLPERAPPTQPSVVVRGEIRWEAAPTWRNGGAFVLWVDGEPKHVLHLTTGLPQPVPDLKAHAGQGARTVEGRLTARKVFGLPVIELRTLER